MFHLSTIRGPKYVELLGLCAAIAAFSLTGATAGEIPGGEDDCPTETITYCTNTCPGATSYCEAKMPSTCGRVVQASSTCPLDPPCFVLVDLPNEFKCKFAK
jgi:hypothetical protein